MTNGFIVPELEYRETFLTKKSRLFFDFSFFAAILICPLFYENFRKQIWNIFWILIYLIILIVFTWNEINTLKIKPILIRENFISLNKETCGRKSCNYKFVTQSKSNFSFSTPIRNSKEIETNESQFIQNPKNGDCISFYIWTNNSLSDFKRC